MEINGQKAGMYVRRCFLRVSCGKLLSLPAMCCLVLVPVDGGIGEASS